MTVHMHPPHDLGGSANVATATQAKTQNGTFAAFPGAAVRLLPGREGDDAERPRGVAHQRQSHAAAPAVC